jgi:hypothetical protein
MVLPKLTMPVTRAATRQWESWRWSVERRFATHAGVLVGGKLR